MATANTPSLKASTRFVSMIEARGCSRPSRSPGLVGVVVFDRDWEHLPVHDLGIRPGKPGAAKDLPARVAGSRRMEIVVASYV